MNNGGGGGGGGAAPRTSQALYLVNVCMLNNYSIQNTTNMEYFVVL